MRFLDRLQPLALLVLRLVLGAVMIAHGYPKVFGGLQGHVHFVSSLHLPGWLAYVSALSEFGGGVLLIAGLLTRLSALAIFIDLCVAIWKVDVHSGFTGGPSHSGYQLPLALASMAFALIFFGAGPISIDAIRGGGRSTLKKST